MKLLSNFEATHSNMMNRDPVPHLDACLSELLQEEQRITTHAVMEQHINSIAPVIDCPQKFYYCKQQGHIITACPTPSANTFTANTFTPDDYVIAPPSSSLSLMPHYLESSQTMEEFKPGFVYERHRPHHGTLHDDAPTLDPNPPPGSCFVYSTSLSAMEHERWKKAIQEELQAVHENHTWDIVSCPSTVKHIGSKWVFFIKLRFDGSLDDYHSNNHCSSCFSILAIASNECEEFFLHGDLKEEICMKLPSDMVTSSSNVCKLRRSLYGLKQAPWAWLENSPLVYVDDLIIKGTNHDLIKKLHIELHATFRMKDLGQLTYFPTLYQCLVGSLIYLTITLPRIFPVCLDTRRSTTDWRIFLGGALISCKCKKQDRVSKSSTEAKYCSMSFACVEVLGFSQPTSTPIHANNTSIIQIVANPVFHEHTKYIEIDCHYIQEALTDPVISLPYISIDLQFLVGKLLLVDLPTSI
ncbi:hypothetical protein V8G54_031210 [Vigna mungo]|uniref:Reverse transcriptase Ty1/copia-type domain-containing protein n=1 Tax=Vigna mungo TaxID=3915 RepID=A0AAQ3MYE5_VIGMU